MRASSIRFAFVVLGFSAFATASVRAQSLIADAAMQGDFDRVVELLQEPVSVDGAQTDGMTALHWAAHHGDERMASRLLAADADFNMQNRVGATPLYLAASAGHSGIISILLDAGADPDAVVTGQDETVLMLAAHSGNTAAVELLLSAGADVNRIQIRGQTALMWAAAEGHTSVVRTLAEHGADLNAQSIASTRVERRPAGGMTALLFAARQGHEDTAEALIELGADVDLSSADGTSPLLIALINGHYELADILLDAGADPSLADDFGRGPLYAAIDLRNQQWSQGPAPELPQSAHLAMIERLLEAGANVEQALADKVVHRGSFDMRWTDMKGGTPFLRAAWNGDIEVMRMLLDHGADPHVATANGETALLLLAGAGWPLGQGYIRTQEEIMAALRLLVEEFGMDVNAATNDGITALMGAVFKADTHIAVAEYLIEHGAKLDAEDNEGRSVYRWTLGVAANGGQPPRPQPEAEVLIKTQLEARGLPVSEGSGRSSGES